MKKSIGIVILALTALNAGCSVSEIGVTKFPPDQVQIAFQADNINWVTCPPVLPKNCEMAILEGHPKKPDIFTIRFKTSGEFYMPPHTHPKDERVTMLQGKAAVAFGVNAKREDAKEFGPGDFYINARSEVHKVWLEKGTILQITGIGPWEANYVD